MSSVYRSLAFSFFEKFSLIGITLLSYILIARLLTPEEIGIYSVAAALIAIGQVVREFGVGNYLIQEKNLTLQHIKTALGVSLLIGSVLFLTVIFSAPLIAVFYKDDRLIVIVRIIALNFLIMPLCSISIALLRREMKFDSLMKINIIAVFVGTTLTLGLAFFGYGPQSLAWGAITTNLIAGVTAWLARRTNNLITPSLIGWQVIFNFGIQSSGAGLVTSIAMGINDLTVGRVLGFAPAAIISRANGLVAIFNQQIMDAIRSVALPAFARAHRENKQLEPIYMESVSAVTAVAWPFYGFLALNASPILRIMFGSQWDEAAYLVPIICLACSITATVSLSLTLAIALGRNDLAAKTDLLLQPIKAAVIVFVAIIYQTLEAIAWAGMIVNLASIPYFFWIKNKILPTNFQKMAYGLFSSLKLSLITLSGPLVLVLFLGSNIFESFFMLTAASVYCFIIWLISLFWIRHPLSSNKLVLVMRNKIINAIPLMNYLLPIDNQL